MRILYHHRTQGRGVEGTHILGIVKAWRKRGIQVDILSPPGVSVEDKPSRQNGRSLGTACLQLVSRHVPEVIFEFMELLYNVWEARSLDRLLSMDCYDLVFERYALLNWAGIRQARKHSTPFILEVNYTSDTPLYRKRSRLLRPLAQRVDRFLFKTATALVAVSSQLKEHLIELGIEADRIIVLPNAADPCAFDPRTSADELRSRLGLMGKKVVGFVGFFYPWHRIELLIDCVPRLKKEIANLAFVLVGDGPTRKALQERVRQEGLEDVVHFLGRIEHEFLPQYIAMFDVALVPHSNSYGSPMKIYEYMAMGKPVVGPNLGPLRDGICSGQEGILFEPGNAKELETALCRLLRDETLRRQMSAAARRKVELVHNWDRNAGDILELYQRKREVSQ